VGSAFGMFVSNALPMYVGTLFGETIMDLSVVIKNPEPEFEVFFLCDMRFRRTIKGNIIVYLSPDETGKCDMPAALFGNPVYMNLNEGRSAEGLVTIVSDRYGRKMRPYYVRNKRSQREHGRDIDARFSLKGPVIVITLDKLGLLKGSISWTEDYLDFVQVESKELFTVVLKRKGGKFFFPDRYFVSSELKPCIPAVKAAIEKANGSEGALYYQENDFVETGDSSTKSRNARLGVETSSQGMTVRSPGLSF